jgi:hypothetical protein
MMTHSKKLKETVASVSFVIVASDSGWAGYWGRGKTIAEAAKACRENGAKKTFPCAGWLVLNDEKAFVDSMGACCYGGADAPEAGCINLGKLGKLGGLL